MLEFQIAQGIAAAIVNDDLSGMSDADCDHITAFCARVRIESVQTDATQWRRCEASGFDADCVSCVGVIL